MSDYEALVEDVVARYPHLVVVMSGPWRDRDGRLEDQPWICNFKNRSRQHQHVHPGSGGSTMLSALQAGIEYLDRHSDDETVHNYGGPIPSDTSQAPS